MYFPVKCPVCGGKLEVQDGEVVCCNNSIHTWPVENGAIMLEPEQEYYWGEICREEMDTIVQAAKEDGWQQAVETFISKAYPQLLSMILGEDRVDWISFFGDRVKSVLDVGGGWGQTGFLLAKDSRRQIVSLEKIKARAMFQSIRAGQEKLDNITVINGDVFDVEFAPESFDLVCYIGVLEWVGVGPLFRDPRRAQVEALKRTHATLKPGGSVVVGIENRIGFNNFLGAKDHSGLRFTGLMDRSVANWYMRLRSPAYRANTSRASYRTYTYSSSGYEKLMRDAGFSAVEIYIAHPHYAHPRCVLPFANEDVRRFFFGNFKTRGLKECVFVNLFRVLSLIGVGHVFAPHFVIIGKK